MNSDWSDQTVTCAEWGCAFLWSRHTPRYDIPLLLFWMARRRCVRVSQYAAALLHQEAWSWPRECLFCPRKQTPWFFFHWNWSFEFFGSGEMHMVPLQWLLLGFRRGGGPCFISSHNGVQKLISFLCVACEKLKRGTHPFHFAIINILGTQHVHSFLYPKFSVTASWIVVLDTSGMVWCNCLIVTCQFARNSPSIS